MPNQWQPSSSGSSGGGGTGFTEVAYAQTTSPVSSAVTTEATATTLVALAPFTPNGTSRYSIEWHFTGYVNGNVVNCDIQFIIHDGTASLGVVWGDFNGATNQLLTGGHGALEYVPSASSKTYSLRFFNPTGATVTIEAGSGGVSTYQPAWIRAVKLN